MSDAKQNAIAAWEWFLKTNKEPNHDHIGRETGFRQQWLEAEARAYYRSRRNLLIGLVVTLGLATPEEADELTTKTLIDLVTC